MRKILASFAAAILLLAASAAVRADQVLPTLQIDAGGNLKFRGGPTLGRYIDGLYVPQAPQRPANDNSTATASTAFVQDAFARSTTTFKGVWNTSQQAAEGPSDASTHKINWGFVGSNNGAISTGVNSTFRINAQSQGGTNAFLWPFLVNYYDSTFKPDGVSNAPFGGYPQNVSGALNFFRYDNGSGAMSNWSAGRIPAEGWALLANSNDLIPWGSAGYPASPPARASLLGAEVDVAVYGKDTNRTRIVVSAVCKEAGDLAIFAQCSTVYGGGNTGTTIGGDRKVTVNNVHETSFQVDHAVFSSINDVLPAGTRDIWMGNSIAGRIAFSADGNTSLTQDGITGALEARTGGNLFDPIVTNGGSGYTSCTATLTGGGGGGTELSCAVTGGAVSSVTLSNPLNPQAYRGNDYTSNPTITITGNGSGATATVQANPLLAVSVGAGIAVNANSLGFSTSTFPVPTSALGRVITYVGIGGTSVTLPNAGTARLGLATVFENRGAGQMIINPFTGNSIKNAADTVILQPGDFVMMLLNADYNWVPLGTSQSTPRDVVTTFAGRSTFNPARGGRLICSDCRKPGEGAGAGTGMPIFADGSGNWYSTAGTAAAN